MKKSYRFVVMEGPPADYPKLFNEALAPLGVDYTIDAYPHINQGDLTAAKLSSIRHLLQRRLPDEVVVFCPGSLEYYLTGPDLSFQFSGYRSFLDPADTVILAHPWHTVQPHISRAKLCWRGKPPFALGFMGQTYANSRAGRLASRMPERARRWLLEGGFGRRIDFVAWLDEHRIRTKFLPTFARFEALEGMARQVRQLPQATIEIVDTKGFTGSSKQKLAFSKHLLQTTYVLCPRGLENYSLRAYEALRFGRIPVIFDNDMAIPEEIPWAQVALVVAGREPDLAFKAIAADYDARSEASFLERQEVAFAVSESLDSQEWLSETVGRALQRFDGKPLPTQKMSG